jgi:hypothetical protein
MNTTCGTGRQLWEAFAQQVVAASGARPADNLTIAGTDHLELLLELIRRGFSQVLCRSADHGPHMATPPADILIAPEVRSEAELSRILTRLGRDLRPRGILVLSVAQTGAACDGRRLRRMLMEAGFTAVERNAASGDAATLWCARKQGASLPRAA